MSIRNYDTLMVRLNSLLECALNGGRLDDPSDPYNNDIETLEFVVSWFEANGDDVREFLEGDN